MSQRAKLYLLFGAPGSGKSEALAYFGGLDSPRIEIVSKQTTRSPRDTDGPEIRCVSQLAPDIDIRYFQYRFEYGMSSRQIWKSLSCGINSAVIANDTRTLQVCRRKFGSLAVCIYIHSNVDEQRMLQLTAERNPEWGQDDIVEDVRKRVIKISSVHRKYIANPLIFDYTILNEYTRASPTSLAVLHRQLDNVLTGPGRRLRLSQARPRIFAIVGASFSGKDKLVNALQQLAPDRAKIYQKYSTRPKRMSDKGELRHRRELPKSCDIRYSRQGFEYGIRTSELWLALQSGVVQLLVVSDIQSIERLRVVFGEICTVLYLHASFDRDEMRRVMKSEGLATDEIETRLNGIDELHDAYCNHMLLFDHVLLNTSEPEDLYDEAFSLLDFYS